MMKKTWFFIISLVIGNSVILSVPQLEVGPFMGRLRGDQKYSRTEISRTRAKAGIGISIVIAATVGGGCCFAYLKSMWPFKRPIDNQSNDIEDPMDDTLRLGASNGVEYQEKTDFFHNNVSVPSEHVYYKKLLKRLERRRKSNNKTYLHTAAMAQDLNDFLFLKRIIDPHTKVTSTLDISEFTQKIIDEWYLVPVVVDGGQLSPQQLTLLDSSMPFNWQTEDVLWMPSCGWETFRYENLLRYDRAAQQFKQAHTTQ